MAIRSCGILLYRTIRSGELEVFLVRANTHYTAPPLWGVPKGRMEVGERPLQTAKREFREETGTVAPQGTYEPLPNFTTRQGKIIIIFTCDAKNYNVQWVRRKVAVTTILKNGQERKYKETSDGKWLTLTEAYKTIGGGQRGILDLFIAKMGLVIPE